MLTPSLLNQYVTAQQNAAHYAGNREACLVARTDAATSRADHWVYEAAWLGIPVEYCDPTYGIWRVPEDICWQCWKPAEGPVVQVLVNACCRHYHPDCWPNHDAELDHGQHAHSCTSTTPHHYGRQ